MPSQFLLLCLVLMLCLTLSALPVHADGGAPNLAYIAGSAHGISVIDIALRRMTSSIAVDGDPHTVLLSLDGRFLYVTQPALGRVAIIVARTGRTFCTIGLSGHPTLLAFSSASSVLYAAANEGTISAIDPATCAVQQTFETHDQVNSFAVVGVTFGNTFSDQLWVAGTTTLTNFDEKGRQHASIPIAGGPQFLSMPTGLTAYVTTRQGTVVAVDTGTYQVSPPLLTGGKFGPMDYDAITLEVYVPDQEANQLDVLSPLQVGTVLPPHEPARVIQLSGSPQAVAITSDGQLGFVALSSGKVAMLDIPGQQLVTTIAVGGMPHFIITGLYPPPGSATPPQVAGSPSSLNTITTLLIALLVIVSLLGLLWLIWRHIRKRTASP